MVDQSAVDISSAPSQPVVNQAPRVSFINPGPAPADKIERAKINTSLITQLQFPEERIKYYIQLEIMDYISGGGNAGRFNQALSITDTIVLPLPDSLRDHLSVDWSEANILRDVFQAAGAIAGGTAMMLAGGAKDVSTAMAGATTLGGAAGVVGGLTYAGGILARLSGIAPNQFLTILLNGPKYKQHDYQWTLAPKTPSEAEKLRRIIQILNNRMSPALSNIHPLGDTIGGLWWNFPSIFKITFMPNEKYLFEHKPAVLANFAIDYAGGHVPSFLRADSQTENLNPPEAVQLHMQFLEIEYWKNGDFGSKFGTAEGTSTAPDVGQRILNDLQIFRERNEPNGNVPGPAPTIT